MANEVTTRIKALAAKLVEMDRLSKSLEHSLAIQNFLPRAFDSGKSCLVGGSSNMYRPWEGTITFHLGSGENVRYRAIDVAVDLWPVEMYAELCNIPVGSRPLSLRGV